MLPAAAMQRSTAGSMTGSTRARHTGFDRLHDGYPGLSVRPDEALFETAGPDPLRTERGVPLTRKQMIGHVRPSHRALYMGLREPLVTAKWGKISYLNSHAVQPRRTDEK
jgi:hypothetical protein